MTADPGHAIGVMREKLEQGEYPNVDAADAEILLEFSDTLRLLGPSEFSDHQHEKLLRRTLVLAREVGGLAEVPENRDAAETLVGHINAEKNGSPETNKDYRVALRQFGKHVTEGDGLPDTVDWIPGGYPSNYDPAPDPADMLRWETDVQPMLGACMNPRDKALVALAWDLGPRPGELFDLQVGAVTDHKYGLQVTLDGKTGRRSPILIPSVPYVRKWLDVHPGGDTDPLWSALKKPGGISNNRVRDILKEIADRAGVDKPVTPTNFRKSSASYLASQGVSQAHLEDHHGWTRGSEIAARYIAVFDDANTREIARAHGLDVEADEPDAVGPIVCPRCEQKTPREEEACVWCGQVLSQDAAESAEEQRGDALEDIRDLDNDDVVEAIMTLESAFGDDVSFRSLLFDG
jgi:hypothetical protein